MNAPSDEHPQHQDLENEPERNDEEGSPSSGLKHNKSAAVSPGEILREGRLAQDYTVEDLCAQTKLGRHTIEALEDNDFETLPQPVFTRGYYRRCAAVLDLDVDRLLAAYTAYAGEPEAPQLNQPVHIDGAATRRASMPGKSRFRGLLVFLILAAAVIAAVVYLMSPNSPLGRLGQSGNASDDQFSTVTSVNTVDDEQDTQIADNDQSETSESAVNGNTGVDGDVDDETTTQDSADEEPGADQQASMGREDQSEPTASGASDEPHHTGGRNLTQAFGIDTAGDTEGAPEESPEENAEPEVAPNVLTLSFSKASWVKVTDANGKQLAQGTYKAGQEEQFEGKPPYKVTLGFAPGVKATIGGEAVDINAQSGGSIVAHLTIKAADEDEGHGRED